MRRLPVRCSGSARWMLRDSFCPCGFVSVVVTRGERVGFHNAGFVLKDRFRWKGEKVTELHVALPSSAAACAFRVSRAPQEDPANARGGRLNARGERCRPEEEGIRLFCIRSLVRERSPPLSS
ncbi:hypothetical protein MRX96_015689 [Rhipicephalus microplus]